MKALIVGTAGVRKSFALNRLQAAIKKSLPDQIVFTRALLHETGAHGARIPVLDRDLYTNSPIAFLELPPDKQRKLWAETFAHHIESFSHAEHTHHILGLHLTFHFAQIPKCTANLTQIANWKPDCIVTLIDDAYYARKRIHDGGYRSFTLPELLLWRAEETLVADLIARTLDPSPPNFLLAVKHPTSTLIKLLFSRDKVARVYMSFPISEIRNDPAKRAVIDRFRSRMHGLESVCAFDPLTIDELPPVLAVPKGSNTAGHFAYKAHSDKHRWPVLNPSAALVPGDDLEKVPAIKIPKWEIDDSREAIDAQVKDRDRRLIEQAHFLVVYRPTLSGKPNLSSGVQAEVGYAKDSGCPILWYVKKGEDKLPQSPFVPKDPTVDPDFVYEANETRFWQKISELHNHVIKARDSFLL